MSFSKTHFFYWVKLVVKCNKLSDTIDEMMNHGYIFKQIARYADSKVTCTCLFVQIRFKVFIYIDDELFCAFNDVFREVFVFPVLDAVRIIMFA